PGETHTSTVLHSDPPGPRLHLWGPNFSRFDGRNTTAKSAHGSGNPQNGLVGFQGIPALSPSRSLGSALAKARCSEPCAGCSCARGIAVAPTCRGRHWRV